MTFKTLREAERYYQTIYCKIQTPNNGYPLFKETHGTSVCLGGYSREADCIINCETTWSGNYGYSRDYCYGYTIWEELYNGYILPSNPKSMAIALITCHDDLNNTSQEEPYWYIIIWSPSKKCWMKPPKKYRKIIEEKYLYENIH